MKKIVVLILFSLVCLGISAETYRINPGQNSVDLLSSDQSHTRISYTISNFEYKPVQIGSETYYQLKFGKEANSYEKGYPEVPQIHRNIIIPGNAKMSVNITESSYVDIPMAVAPSKGIITRDVDPGTVPYTFSPIYQKAEMYPAAVSDLSSPFIMRDFRGITVIASPFVYYPLTGTLRVYTHLVLDVAADGTDNVNTLSRNTTEYSKYFESIYQNLFMNFTQDRYTLVNDRGRMIVIAPASYIATAQTFVNWKNQKGLSTTLVDFSTIGTTYTQLKTYIQAQYALNNGLTFVQLCGDAAQIPTFTSQGGGSDPSYSLLAGSDNYPEIIIGRFSAETTAQLQTQVDRSIQYERDLTTSATWLQSATGIASAEGGGTMGDNLESDATHMNNIRTQLLAYGYTAVDQIYEGTGGSAANITTALNAGRGFVNYVGHGSDTSWASVTYTNTNVTALTNANKLPFIMDVACVNGNFVSITCFAEAWMRATSGGSPSGAVGIYASSINQSWNSPMLAEDEFTDLMTAGTKNTLGGLYYNSSCKMMESYGTDGQNMFLTWHIFGDPSLQIRSKTPTTMTVSYPASIPIGSTSITVSTGVTDALVCLSYNNQILGKGYTVSGGSATITLSNMPTTPVTLTMTVTAFDKVTQVGNVALTASSGPWVSVDSYAYADANNNLPDYNESGRFNMTYKNTGTATATNIVTTLSTTASGITITDNTETIASLAAGASSTVNTAYTFTTANNIADQTSIPFHMTLVSGTNNWTYDFNTVINAPVLGFGAMVVNDPTPGGNNNGRLDPGETVTVSMPLNNTGHAATVAGTTAMTSSSTGVTITSGTYNAASIAASGTATATFTMSLSASIAVGSTITLNFNATAGTYTASRTESPAVGIVMETFETGNLTAFSWVTSGTAPYWSVVNTGAYAGTYCAKSGAITHSQTTNLSVTMTVTTAGNITFYKKVSSESAYDYLKFYIDATETGSWSGAETAFAQVTYPVTVGSHTFKWAYIKDSSVSTGSDCAWVDNIVFPPTAAATPTFNPPQNLTAVGKNGKVILTWAAPSSGTPSSYKVFRNSVAVATGITGLTYNNTGLTNGTSYSFYVTAVYNSPSAGESAPGNTVSATPIAAVPTALTATPANAQVTLNWIAPTTETPDGYKVYRNSVLLTATPITATTYTDTAVINETSYSYNVTSVFNTPAGESAASITASATPTNSLIVTIGSGITAARYPLASYMGYERSANLFLNTEVTSYGLIQTLAWNPTVTTTASIPVKIYLKTFPTTATALSATRWGTMTTGATLVYNGTITPATAGIWKTIDITDYSYTTGNLVVMVECNYGGTGDAGTTTGAGYSYSVTTGSKAQNWGANTTEPVVNGTLSTSRPNIRLTMISGPVFEMTPASLDFASVQVGQTLTRSFTITNLGGSTLTGDISTPAGYSVVLSARNTQSYSIASGASGTFTVTFAPTAVQAYNGSISITSNDTNHALNSISVTGTGITLPGITVSSIALTPSLLPNATGSELLTIGNTGSTALTYSIGITYGATVMSWLSIDPSTGSIAGSSSADLTVSYDTAGLTAGSYTATIAITSNDPVNPIREVTVNLTVQFVNHTPTIILPTTFNFDKNGTLTEDYSTYVQDVDNDILTITYSGNTHIFINVIGMQITFTADADWVGTENITFTADDGYRAFASDIVAVTVNPINVPTWTPVTYPNPQAMIYTTVTIDNVAAQPGDIIAAFVNGECRGTAVLEAVRATSAILLINVANDGEVVYFKLYDQSNDQVFDAANTVTINVGETLGAPGNDIPVEVITIVASPTNVQIHKQSADLAISWPVVPNANTYHVYRSDTPGGTYTLIGTVHTNSYLDIDAAGRSNFYQITAENIIVK